MSTSTLPLAWSPGWNQRVALGSGLERMLRELRAIRGAHPSRTWQNARPMRDYERSPGTAHRLIHRLNGLGLIAIQSVLGRFGVVRFTFLVRFWHRQPVRRGMLARFTVSPGQLALMAPEDTLPLFPDAGALSPPDAPASLAPPIVEPPERPPVPQRDPALAGETFAEKMRRHGLDEATFWKTGWK